MFGALYYRGESLRNGLYIQFYSDHEFSLSGFELTFEFSAGIGNLLNVNVYGLWISHRLHMTLDVDREGTCATCKQNMGYLIRELSQFAKKNTSTLYTLSCHLYDTRIIPMSLKLYI